MKAVGVNGPAEDFVSISYERFKDWLFELDQKGEKKPDCIKYTTVSKVTYRRLKKGPSTEGSDE